MTVAVSRRGEVAVVTIDNPPVNAASVAVRRGLADAVAECDADRALRAVVLACAGRTFVAGADIREFGRPPEPPHLPDVARAIEEARLPWVAAIHGTALGGGLELALACRGRVAAPDAKLGLPEVNLGLIPGAGGTVRLPRLVDPEVALRMIAGGKPVGADEALETGLVDEVSDAPVETAVTFAIRFADTLPTLRRPPKPPSDPAAYEAEKSRLARRARGQDSIHEAIAAVDRALALPAEEALSKEREAFLRLKESDQSAALRHVFFAERSTLKDPRFDADPRPLNHVGIVGGGTMGAGIAAACLLHGLSVILLERNDKTLADGKARVVSILDESLKRGILDAASRASAEARLTAATDIGALSQADLVIEAVFEDMEVKRDVFRRLDGATRPDAVLTTNTSYLDVGELAACLDDPSRMIGLHFFSPAHIMKLLEIVLPTTAAPTAAATGAALAKQLRKIAVPAGVCDGFIGNRIMSAYRREADYIVEDGADPADIDRAMRGFGFPMGIFEMQDLAGLDIAWAMRKRKAATRDPAERYVRIADRLCEAGRLGRKTGRGWYIYRDGKAVPDPEVDAIIAEERAAKGITPREMSGDEIMDRILSVMQDEAQAVLNEGVAAKPGDIDVVMINGYGFPRWRGGPMWMAGHRG